MLNKEYWEKKHKESEGKFNRVTDFARLCYNNFMKRKGKVLDLCCGKGSDAIYFHNKRFLVTAIDYSNEAIRQFNETQKRYGIFISTLVKDILETLPFNDESFDYVYSRLGLGYFTDEELKKILAEVNRILKKGGLFFIQVKSVNDILYGKGKLIEKDMYEDETGYVRHFFSKEYAEELFSDFHILMVEERNIEQGSSYMEIVLEKK
ncbi:MAG: class I SAM-dependent methyltransferase [Candidatus Woesearchaeota archaeon]